MASDDQMARSRHRGNVQAKLVEARPRKARQPLRERGVIRFEALLKAAETLLLERNADDFGLYQIAEAVGVKPATVYHFFPTKNAVFLTLAERYHADFRRIAVQPYPASDLISWQDLVVGGQRRAVSYYNTNLVAAKLLLGMHPSGEIHHADLQYNALASSAAFKVFDRLFVMPYVTDFDHKFEVVMALADAVWSLSFERHGHINERYAQDAVEACIAYCKTFLPDRVERRPAVVDAAERGQLIEIGPRELA